MEPRLYCLDVPTELLVDSVVGLGHCFVGVLYAAAADTGTPGPQTTTALSPAVQTFAIGRHISVVLVHFWQLNMFWLPCESFMFVLHIGLQCDFSHYTLYQIPIDLSISLNLLFGYVPPFLCLSSTILFYQ